MPITLAFEATGHGEPLLILHGLFGSGGNWRGVARELATHNRVYCVDLRNHGASPWADSMGYLEMADDVKRLIDREGLRRPAVIGHSMGGKTAMALALMYPESIGALVAVDIAPVSYADRLSPYVEAMRSIGTFAVASRAEAQRRLAATISDAGIAAFLMTNLVARNEHFDWRLNLTTIGASMSVLCDFPSQLAGLRFKRAMTAIVGGRSDYVKPPDKSLFEPLFSKVVVDEIVDAGHWLHAEQPTQFLAAARRALARTSPRAAMAA